MSIQPFDPKFMRVGVLTAALQELTPRALRDADPDRAIEDWLQFALEIGASYIQLSAALHPSQADVPPEAMLDPVANTLDPAAVRSHPCRARAGRSGECRRGPLGLYFDNLLHHDPATSEETTSRACSTQQRSCVDAVCGLSAQPAARHGREHGGFQERCVPL
jgi:hypothetical protein